MILTAGLTPAWQHVLVFDTFQPGEVNRAQQVHWCASGKVLNASRAVHQLGAEQTALCLVGGPYGAAIRDDFGAQGIRACWVQSQAPTRVCTTIVAGATGLTTELVENSSPVSRGELDRFAEQFRQLAAKVDVAVLIGSLPEAAPADYYASLLKEFSGTVILDARGPELLAALACRPTVVKPNRFELEMTVGRALADQRDLLVAMRELIDRGAHWAVVTQGSGPVLVCSRQEAYRIDPPPGKVVSPIGCGDCLAAAMAVALERGQSVPSALRLGVAAALDNLGQPLPAALDPKRIDQILPSITLETVSLPGG